MDDKQKAYLPTREKYWKELTPDEKIERTRQEVNIMKNQINELFALMIKLSEQFDHHHHLDSKIVVDLNIQIPGIWEKDIARRKSVNSDEVYF